MVEAQWTFQGGEKDAEFGFSEMGDEYRKQFPLSVFVLDKMFGDDAWAREAYQRNSILTGLEAVGASDEDIVLISDADEIPSAESVVRAIATLELTGAPQVALTQELCFYFVNNICFTQKWFGTQVCTVGHARETSPEGVRGFRNSSMAVRGGGVHWCNMGGPEWLVEKIESFAHTEVNLPQYKDIEFLESCIKAGREMTGRHDILFRFEDPTTIWLPDYFRQNPEKFAHLLAPEPLAIT